ncbi:MAG TPA: hypothetical protein G4N95_00300 [Anaerolineae bacterium]|nr:hypothetical protein [Anaerolineae bacterium]
MRDLRRYARQTNIRLFVGFILILFIIGDSLIYWLYSREAAILGLLCLVMGLIPLILIFIFLALLEWIVKRAKEE